MNDVESPRSGSPLRWLVILLLVAAGVAVAYQRSAMSQLRREAAALRQQAEAAQREAEAAAQGTAAESPEIQQLRNDNRELLALRNEVRQLREQVKELPRLQAESQRLMAEKQSLAAEAAAAVTKAQEATNAAAVIAFQEAQAKALSSRCVANLKQIGLAGRIWANQHNNVLPPDFLSMANELRSPRILICPGDPARAPQINPAGTPIATFPAQNVFDPNNISYMMVSPGVQVDQGQLAYVQCPIHGHVCRVDGSVQEAVANPQ